MDYNNIQTNCQMGVSPLLLRHTDFFLKSLEPSWVSYFVPLSISSLDKQDPECAGPISPLCLTLISQPGHTSVSSTETAHRLLWDSLDNSRGSQDHSLGTSSCQPTAQSESPKNNEIAFRIA